MHVAIILAALACQEPVVGLPPFTPTLLETRLWSGGELRVSASAFAPPAPLPTLWLGADTLPVFRLDDTTVAARLPITTGTFSVKVVAGRQVAFLDDVTLHGFLDERAGPPMAGQPYWLPGGAPMVITGGDPGAIVVDLRYSTVARIIPDSIFSPDCAMSVGPTYRADRFVFEGKSAGGACGPPKVWSIGNPPQLVDTVPQGSFTWYTMGQPADRRWVFNWNNNNLFRNCDTGVCVTTSFLSPDGPNGVTISPRGDRFLWLPQSTTVTVWDALTFDTAFVLPEFERAFGSAFSSEGDTLFLGAQDTVGRGHILAVRAADGAVLRTFAFDSLHLPGATHVEPWSVALDPVRPWVYAELFVRTDTTQTTVLVVLNRTTWAVVGVAPVGVASLGRMATTIVPSPLERKVYVVSTIQSYSVFGTPGHILRFSTP